MGKYIDLMLALNKLWKLCVEDIDAEISESETFDFGRARDALSDLPTIEVSEDVISREDAVNALIAHFIPQTYTGEQVEQASKLAWKIMANAPSVIPANENEIKLCMNCDNAYLYQDCLYCDEIEEETEIEPDDACSLWKLRESSVKPKEGEWIDTDNPLRLDDKCYINWACSRCGNISFTKTNFCDNCGAKMKGAE